MKIVAGLGNIGNEYANTYHNIGFMVVDEIAERLGVKFSQKKFNADVAKFKDIIFIKPRTYMNLSGTSILSFKTKFKIENKDIYVIVDDIDLKKGTFRFRENGSAGTHNGMRNIVSQIGTDFPRLRIGIMSEKNVEIKDYVTSKIDAEDSKILAEAISQAADFLMEKLGM